MATIKKYEKYRIGDIAYYVYYRLANEFEHRIDRTAKGLTDNFPLLALADYAVDVRYNKIVKFRYELEYVLDAHVLTQVEMA